MYGRQLCGFAFHSYTILHFQNLLIMDDYPDVLLLLERRKTKWQQAHYALLGLEQSASSQTAGESVSDGIDIVHGSQNQNGVSDTSAETAEAENTIQSRRHVTSADQRTGSAGSDIEVTSPERYI